MPYRRYLPPRPEWVTLHAKLRLLDRHVRVWRRENKLAVQVSRDGARRVRDALQTIMGRRFKIVKTHLSTGAGLITLTRKSIKWKRGEWGTINNASDEVRLTFRMLKPIKLKWDNGFIEWDRPVECPPLTRAQRKNRRAKVGRIPT